MKRLFISLSLILFLFGAQGQTIWHIDNDNVLISWNLPSEANFGKFTKITADIAFDPANVEHSKMAAKVDVKSLIAGDKEMETHLKSSDFFDAEKYPELFFSSRKIVAKDKGFVVTGVIVIKDKNVPVEIPFTFVEKDGGAIFSGSFTLTCEEVGIPVNKNNTPSVIEITIQIGVTK